jgi:predicted GIY-YIG superfamily endonuclease
MFYVYVIKQNHQLYIGYTEDLRRRIKQHQRKGNLTLIYYEAYHSKALSMQREKKLKHYGSAWRALKKRIIA